MGKLDYRFEIGDTVYLLDYRKKKIPTGVKCSFCGGTGIAPWDDKAKEKCTAIAYPYVCVNGEIHKCAKIAHVSKRIVSGVSVGKQRSIINIENTFFTESYWLDKEGRQCDGGMLFATQGEAEEAVRKYNQKYENLFCNPDGRNDCHGND